MVGWFARDMLAIEAVPAPEATTVTVAPTHRGGPAHELPARRSAPPETMPPVVVTLVDVEADLWWR